MNHLVSLWETHREAEWPRFSSPHQGELMTLDTVISGCVTYHLESSDGLDPQRLAMLDRCLTELDGLLPELPEEVQPYFRQLWELAAALRRQSHGPQSP